MLVLGLSIGKEHYGIEATRIIEIVPLIELKKVPLTENAVKGIFNYRGTATPVIDLCQLFEKRSCTNDLSSRIIIINYNDSSENSRPVGLVAERVTDVMKCEIDDVSNSGIQSDKNKFLGKVYKYKNDLIQLIDTHNVLPDSISRQLASSQLADKLG